MRWAETTPRKPSSKARCLPLRSLPCELVLVGEQDAIERELAKHRGAPKFDIVAASQVVPMHESPSAALRKKDSSIESCFEMMRRGEVDAVVSAGNSGAMMAIGMFVMGTLSQVARPAILVVVPSLSKGTVIVDAGANVDCKPLPLGPVRAHGFDLCRARARCVPTHGSVF